MADTPAAPAAPETPAVGTPAAPAPAPAPTGPSAEEIRAQVTAEYAAALKAATGHESIEALKAAQEAAEAKKLADQGEYKILAEKAETQLAQIKAAYRAERVRGAILSAAGEAMDAEVVHQLLASGADVGTDGAVTIGGKPTAEAVAQILKDKPYLAKPAPSQGSGSGGGGGAPKAGAPDRKDYTSEIDYHRARAQFEAAQ